MARTIIVMVSMFAFALVGVLIGWGMAKSIAGDHGGLNNASVFGCFIATPFVSAAIGFWSALIALKVFPPDKN